MLLKKRLYIGYLKSKWFWKACEKPYLEFYGKQRVEKGSS
jgi:hypothetical protein